MQIEIFFINSQTRSLSAMALPHRQVELVICGITYGVAEVVPPFRAAGARIRTWSGLGDD